MSLLLDSCVWGGAVEELRSSGHDVVWSGDWSKDPGDGEIFRFTYENERILITLTRILANMPSPLASRMWASFVLLVLRHGVKALQ